MPRGQAPQPHKEAFYRLNRAKCDSCNFWRGMFWLAIAMNFVGMFLYLTK